MKKIKFKTLILLIFTLVIIKYPLDIFADTTSENNTVSKSHQTTLDGEIGEWDPYLDDKPNFDDPNLEEFEGNKPNENQYYTISVTVPLNMEFYVLPNSKLAFGSFYSPIYKIKNNGSKNISMKLSSFNMQSKINDEQSTPLYIEELNSGDGKTQMELNMCAMEDLSTNKVTKEINLTRLNDLDESERELYILGANDIKGVKFASKRWELPQYESNKEQAISNFTASFEFSIKR